MTAPLAPNQVAARLDRLPVGRFHRRFLTAIALGAWFDYYDNFVAGSLAVILLALRLAAAAVVGCNWFSAVFHAYHAELFPTEARATGVGFTYAWSRASMVAVNLFMPALINRSPLVALGLPAAAFAGVAVVIGLFGPLTNARTLEEVAG